MTTTVVNLRKQPYDIYIGRGSPWGNPFSHMLGTKAEHVVGSREEAIEAYERWLDTQPELLAALPVLRGKTLGCYCKPAACHGDVLARKADELGVREPRPPGPRGDTDALKPTDWMVQQYGERDEPENAPGDVQGEIA